MFNNTKQNDDGTFSWLHHMERLAATSPVRTPDFSSLWTPLEQLRIPVILVRGEHGFVNEPAATTCKKSNPLPWQVCSRIVDSAPLRESVLGLPKF